MKIEIEKIKNKKKEITLISIVIIVCILFFSGYSLGKGISNTNIDGNVEIAKPIVVVENDSALDITAQNNVGTYHFKVKNYNENEEITQVDMKYNIEILSELEDVIQIKLYKDEIEISIENNVTKEFILEKQEKQEHNYKLEITYDKNKESTIEEIMQDLQIKVHSEQVKTS